MISACTIRKVGAAVLLVFGTQSFLTTCQKKPGNDTYVPSHYIKKDNSHKLIIFVHGVIGNADSTWTNAVTNANWPDLLSSDPDMQGFDIFTYGYLSPSLGQASDIYEIATRFGQELKDWKIYSNYDQVFFITHSMGGIITKDVLDQLNTPADVDKLHHVRAAVYIAVPSNGADIAAVAGWISLNPQFKSMNPSSAVDFLQTIEGEWEGVCHARTPQEPFPLSFVAYETLPTHGVRVVPSLYTSHEADSPPIGFDYDHIDIVKPSDRNNDVYVWTKARLLDASQMLLSQNQTSQPIAVAKKTASSLPSGHIVLFDGFTNANASGLKFSTGKVVSWFSGEADILVSNTQPPQPTAMLFTQEDAGGVYQNAPYDKGSNGGIVKINVGALDAVHEAPVTGYLSHWFRAELGGIYCVRTRDGEHFAKIQVTDMQSDRLGFDWIYQPAKDRRFQ